MTSGEGTGIYEGSHYQYSEQTGTYDGNSSPVMLPTYRGKVTSINGVPHVYFSPRNDYY